MWVDVGSEEENFVGAEVSVAPIELVHVVAAFLCRDGPDIF